MKKIILSLVIFLSFINITHSQQDTNYKNTSIVSSIAIQGNFYSSNFRSLPGYPSCCTNYDFAFGIGQHFSLGLEQRLSEKLFGANLSYIIATNFSNQSAKYSIDEFIGYYIEGNNSQKIISNYILDINLKTLGLITKLNISPQIDIPLEFSLGMHFDFPVIKDVYKVEKLKKPSDIFYSDTKSRKRAEQSGSLNELSSVLYSLSFGISYYSINFSNLSIKPNLEMNIGLNDVVKNTNWKIWNSKIGIAINYNIPKKKEEPKIQPLIPPMPEPALPESPNYDYKIICKYSNVELKDSMNIIIPIFADMPAEVILFPPVIYFKKNSGELYNTLIPINSIAKKFDLDSAFANFVRNNEVNVLVKINRLQDESPKAFEERKQKILEIVRKFAPNTIDLYEFQENIIPKDSIESRISDEYITAHFKYKEFGNINFTHYKESEKRYYSRDRNVVFINAEIPFEFEKYNIKVIIDDSIFYENDKINSRFNIIDDYYLHKGFVSTPLRVKSTVQLKNGIILEKERLFYIKPQLAKINILVNTSEGKEYAVLGLFDYDSSEFSYVDKRVRNKVYDDVNIRNKRITIIPFTDNIGGATYNRKLAEARAQSAVKILGLREGDYSIEYTNQYLFDNKTPLGRALNRCVIVVIEKR